MLKKKNWTLVVGFFCVIAMLGTYSNCAKQYSNSFFTNNVAIPNINFATAMANRWDVRFAVIGDYGQQGDKERKISELLKSWNVDFIITTGDNNYYWGQWETLEQNIGQYYSDFIFPYRYTTGPSRGMIDPSRGSPTRTNRFFPALGNHDWYATSPRPDVAVTAPAGHPPLTDWLDLPEGEGRKRYYDFVKGPVHFFAVDSDPNYEGPLDGVTAGSKQGNWLQRGLEHSSAPFKLVYFHHPTFSSGNHGNSPHMNWPFRQWGASIVMMGHEHVYEQYSNDGIYYIINGIGGADLTPFDPKAPILQDSRRFNDKFGAMLVMANGTEMLTQLYDEDGIAVPEMSVRIGPSGAPLVSLPEVIVNDPYVGATSNGISYITITGKDWSAFESDRPLDYSVTVSPEDCKFNTTDSNYYAGRDGSDLKDIHRHQINLPIKTPNKDLTCAFTIKRNLDSAFKLQYLKISGSQTALPSPSPNKYCELRVQAPIGSGKDGLLDLGQAVSVANGSGTEHPTTLTFVRKGDAEGNFLWWIAGVEPNEPKGLENSENKITLNYIGVPAKTYIVFSEVRNSNGATKCSPLTVNVVQSR